MDLPRLVVADTLRRNHLRRVEAYYDPRDNTVYLDEQRFFRLTPDIAIFTLIHELGHWFRVAHVPEDEIVGWQPDQGFFIFGAPNYEEGFADAFATYMLDPGELKGRYPQQFAAMRKQVDGRRGKLDPWISGNCRRLGLDGKGHFKPPRQD